MRDYEEIAEDIGKNAKDILSGDVSERGLKRAEGCLRAIMCEILLDIRDILPGTGRGTIVPSCVIPEDDIE